MFSQLSLAASVGNYSNAQTAAGSTQADAAPIIASHVQVASVGSGAGIILRPLPANHAYVVTNGDAANALSVYPPVGGKFNNAAANLPLVVPAGQSAWAMAQDNLNFTVVL